MDGSQLLSARVIGWFRDFGRDWSVFWFEADASARIRLFRPVISLLLLAFFLIRTFDLELLYSNQGLFPVEVLKEVMPIGRPSLLVLFSATPALWAFHIFFLICLVAMAIGFWPRLFSAMAYVIHVSFIHRNLGSVYGVDFIATFYFAYLALMREHREGEPPADSLWRRLDRDIRSIGFRLAQIQLCIIYLYSGIGKLKGSHWWSGEAVWDVLANVQLARWDFSWVSHFPALVALATYVTLAWEIYFSVTVWVPRLRYPTLIGGIFLHIGIALGMNLVFFGSLMATVYILFLKEEDARSFLGWVSKRFRFRT